jgi:hypothetical protein
MGSSDPLPAGFEIRFGSLNFQATGNDYLMRITNRDELHLWRSTGPGPVPTTPAADASAPAPAALEPGAKRAPTSPAGGTDINTQVAQARELKAKLAEEYRAVRLLRATIAREASARGERVRELGKQVCERINADFNIDDPSTPPRVSQKLIAVVMLLRAMPAPSKPEARNLHREAQALIEQAAVQQAESSVSRIRHQGSAQDDGGA